MALGVLSRIRQINIGGIKSAIGRQVQRRKKGVIRRIRKRIRKGSLTQRAKRIQSVLERRRSRTAAPRRGLLARLRRRRGQVTPAQLQSRQRLRRALVGINLRRRRRVRNVSIAGGALGIAGGVGVARRRRRQQRRR